MISDRARVRIASSDTKALWLIIRAKRQAGGRKFVVVVMPAPKMGIVEDGQLLFEVEHAVERGGTQAPGERDHSARPVRDSGRPGKG